ncbi:MAG: MBL fold metallo-hydrolase [Acidobacteria bacterium]|nr:MBL fold metallo-hydrolase [Acidobacteriota bacterium]
MARRFWLLGAILLLAAPPADAQDARAVLQAASAAMGADGVRTIQYSGTGWNAAVGQSFNPAQDWPRFEITAYTRTLDYEGRSSREELTRRQGSYLPQGGGGTPLQGEQQQRFYVSGASAWNVQGTTAAPAPAAAEVRQLDIWLSPHGFLKAAMASGSVTATPLMLEGRRLTIVSFTQGKFRINGTITDQNLVERVQTWVPSPVLGDMVYEHRYTDYKDFGSVKFPTVLHSHQGDPRLNPGHNWMEIRVTSVQPNAAVAALAVPDTVRAATVPPVAVESQQLAGGVWRIAGGTHHSVAVEFRDFVAVVEAPQNEARSLAVIAEVRRLIPNKPIRYVVNTHHHFDHSGGLRTYVAESATVVTHQQNREFYEDVLLYPAPRTLEPDRLSTLYPWFAGNRVPGIETVSQKYVVSDGVRTLDLYPVQGLAHANTMLIAYLPTEKILINADLYGPPAPGAQPPAPNASMLALRQNIQRLNLDVAQHVGIHGTVGSHADFMAIVNRPASN